jgi:hypothetical protein
VNDKPINMVEFANALLAAPVTYRPVCAHCQKEMNIKPQPDETHGICKRHRLQVEAEFLRWLNINAAEEAMAKGKA